MKIIESEKFNESDKMLNLKKGSKTLSKRKDEIRINNR